MGGIVGKSKDYRKGDCETGKTEIERLRLSRKQQYELFKFIMDKPEEDIVQHVHDVPEIPTAVMHFKIYCMDYPEVHCNCAYIVEQGLPSDGPPPVSAMDLLENCIKFGCCPHLILDKNGEVNVLKQSYKLEDIYNTYVLEKETTVFSSTKSSSAGLYVIHLLLILGKIRLFPKILKSIQWDRIPKYMLFTCLHKFSPFHLAVIHNYDTLFDCLMIYFKHVLFDGCFEYTGYSFGERASVLDFASRMEKIEILRKLVALWKTNPSRAMSFAVSNRKLKSILLFKEYGVSFHHFTFEEAVRESVQKSDKEWLSVLLELKETKGYEPHVLNEAVLTGSIEILSLVMEKLHTNLKKSKSRKQVKNCLAILVLLHDVKKAEILIRFGLNVNALYRNRSTLFWSENLGLVQMSNILKKNGAKSFTTIKYDHDDDFLDDVINANVNTLPNVKYLIEAGFDVNGKNKKGFPLLDAVNLGEFDTVEYLLSHGAETNSLTDVYSATFDTKKKLLILFIKYNVDLSTDGESSMLRICRSYHQCVKVLLLTAHTISKTDTDYLRSYYLHEEYTNEDVEWGLPEIMEKIFYCPKSLQLICRDSIRKHAGRSFIKYIDEIKGNIPTYFLKLLQCEDLLEMFEEETKQLSTPTRTFI